MSRVGPTMERMSKNGDASSQPAGWTSLNVAIGREPPPDAIASTRTSKNGPSSSRIVTT